MPTTLWKQFWTHFWQHLCYSNQRNQQKQSKLFFRFSQATILVNLQTNWKIYFHKMTRSQSLCTICSKCFYNAKKDDSTTGDGTTAELTGSKFWVRSHMRGWPLGNTYLHLLIPMKKNTTWTRTKVWTTYRTNSIEVVSMSDAKHEIKFDINWPLYDMTERTQWLRQQTGEWWHKQAQ